MLKLLLIGQLLVRILRIKFLYFTRPSQPHVVMRYVVEFVLAFPQKPFTCESLSVLKDHVLMQLQEPRKKQKAGSSSERPRTEDDSSDSLAAAIKVTNIPNQMGHGVLVTKPKPPPMVTIRNDESTVEDRSLFLVSTQRTWPLAESVLKRKLPLDGMVRNPTKFSNLKEKVREGSEGQRDGVVLGEKNPLLKKRRKKVKSGIEFDITAPTFPLVNIDEGIELAHSVSKVSKKRPNITGELSDDEARRASMKVVKQKQPEKPPVI